MLVNWLYPLFRNIWKWDHQVLSSVQKGTVCIPCKQTIKNHFAVKINNFPKISKKRLFIYLSHVPLALRVARKSRRVIKQNIALSLGLKLAFLALAIPGIATLWMAVLADVGATLLVTLNGMRMLRQS